MSAKGNALASYPKTYRAIKEMVQNEALLTHTARGVARKAGLRSGTATPGGPVTLVDATVGPSLISSEWQWLVNLSGYTRVRMDARGDAPLHARYSLAGASTTDLNPGDYAPFSGGLDGLKAEDTDGYPSDALGWVTLAPGERAPVRLCVMSDAASLTTPADLGGPVGVWIQAE